MLTALDASGGIEAAKEVCRNTKGPVCQYLIIRDWTGQPMIGLEVVEKSIVAYGGVQMGLLEKGCFLGISIYMLLAPMLGFMGTVIGMIWCL